VARALSAVDMQDFAGDEGRAFEVEHSGDDVVDGAEPSQGMQTGQGGVIGRGVHRGVDDPRRDRVDPNSTARVLGCQRFGDSRQAALGQGGQRGRDAGVGVFDQCGGHIDHVPALALGEHLRDHALGDVKEAGQVHRGDMSVVGLGVLGERLRDEHAGAVDQRVDPSEPFDARRHEAVGGGGIGDVPRDDGYAGVVGSGDGARVRHHRVVQLAVGLNQRSAHSLRCARDDDDSLLARLRRGRSR
jgi:hypothetical protein